MHLAPFDMILFLNQEQFMAVPAVANLINLNCIPICFWPAIENANIHWNSLHSGHGVSLVWLCTIWEWFLPRCHVTTVLTASVYCKHIFYTVQSKLRRSKSWYFVQLLKSRVRRCVIPTVCVSGHWTTRTFIFSDFQTYFYIFASRGLDFRQ